MSASSFILYKINPLADPGIILAPITDVFNHLKGFGVTPSGDLRSSGSALSQ